jgi:hypothetical protein
MVSRLQKDDNIIKKECINRNIRNPRSVFNIKWRLVYLSIGIVIFLIVYYVGTSIQLSDEQADYIKQELQQRNRNLFDIVSSTSIGAINATVLVGHFLKNKNSWEGAPEKLIEFWKGLMTPTIADIFIGDNPFINNWWDYLHTNIDSTIANADYG